MAASKFPVIYSAQTGRIRSWWKLDDDSELQIVKTLPGELFSVFPMEEYGDLPILQELISRVTGLAPKDDRYAVVDSRGVVIGAIHADLACGDKVDGHELIPHNEAGPGWVKDSDGKMKDTRPVPNDPPKQVKP